MSDSKSPEDFLSRIESGEFNGRLYKTILNLSSTDLQQIAAVLRDRRATSSGEPGAPADSSGLRPDETI